MLLTTMQRRRVAPLEVMRVIPEQEYGIAHPCEINHPHLKKGSRTFYSNPWFFYKKKQRRMDVVLLFLSVAYSIIALEKMRCSMMTSNKHPTRPPIHYSFPFAHVDKTLSRFQRDSPDYGGIAFSSLQNASHFRRKISPKNAKTFERNRQQAMTDEHSVAEKQVGHNCRQPSWQSHFYPTCNVMHEGDYIADDSSVQIGNGYYREAWLVNSTQPLIVKALKMKHDINDDTVHQVIQDAVIMEHLSPSPRIMDMYSLCGTSLVVKSMPVSVEKQIVPPGTWDATNEPRNDLSPSTKLAMALEMAESLADLHGFRQGVIVHGDVQLGQWLQESSNGTLVLGDFNLARVLGWDETKQRYCKYKVGRGHGNYRAPEEVQSKLLDEKIDVFSFGNNVFAILTGRRVYYEINGDKKKALNGFMATAEENYQNRSFAEGKLVELLRRCWELDPSKRIDIFQAVRFLQDAIRRSKS